MTAITPRELLLTLIIAGSLWIIHPSIRGRYGRGLLLLSHVPVPAPTSKILFTNTQGELTGYSFQFPIWNAEILHSLLSRKTKRNQLKTKAQEITLEV
jgi:hypothetical protein